MSAYLSFCGFQITTPEDPRINPFSIRTRFTNGLILSFSVTTHIPTYLLMYTQILRSNFNLKKVIALEPAKFCKSLFLLFYYFLKKNWYRCKTEVTLSTFYDTYVLISCSPLLCMSHPRPDTTDLLYKYKKEGYFALFTQISLLPPHSIYRLYWTILFPWEREKHKKPPTAVEGYVRARGLITNMFSWEGITRRRSKWPQPSFILHDSFLTYISKEKAQQKCLQSRNIAFAEMRFFQWNRGWTGTWCLGQRIPVTQLAASRVVQISVTHVAGRLIVLDLSLTRNPIAGCVA